MNIVIRYGQLVIFEEFMEICLLNLSNNIFCIEHHSIILAFAYFETCNE